MTWAGQRTAIPNTAALNVMSPAVRRLADGGLGMVYSHREATSSAWRVFVRSDDEGPTWSPGQRLPQQEPYTTGCHDRLTVLDGGRLVAPLHCTPDWHHHHLAVRCAWSDDHGRRWRLSPAIELPRVADCGESGCIEPDVAQRSDGSLLMAIRTAMGTVFRAEIRRRRRDLDGAALDGGGQPGGAGPAAPHPGHGRSAADLELALRLARAPGRQAPAPGLRREHGRGDSWPLSRRKVLEDDPAHSASYPTCTFGGGDAFITYRWGGHITGAYDPEDPSGWISSKAVRLPLSWLYA